MLGTIINIKNKIISAIILLLIFNLYILCVFSLVILKIINIFLFKSEKTFHHYANFIMKVGYLFVLFLLDCLINLKIYLHSNDLNQLKSKINKIINNNKNVLIIYNHQSVIDHIIIAYLMYWCGVLGKQRLVKSIFSRYDLFSRYICKLIGDIGINNKGKFEEKQILKPLQFYAQNKINVWIAIASEGVLFYPNDVGRLISSKNVCISKGYEPFEMVYAPKIKGTKLILDSDLKFDCILDITSIFGNIFDKSKLVRLPLTNILSFAGKSQRVDVYVDYINIEDIPIKNKQTSFNTKYIQLKPKFLHGFLSFFICLLLFLLIFMSLPYGWVCLLLIWTIESILYFIKYFILYYMFYKIKD